MIAQIQLRRGTTSEWAASAAVLASGEPGFDTTFERMKIGNGTDLWASLPWATNADLESQISALASGSPAGTYATLAALNSTDPDHAYIYITLYDGKWCYYDTGTSAFVAGGVYQSASVDDDVDAIFEATMSRSTNIIGKTVFNGAIFNDTGVFDGGGAFATWWSTDYIPVTPGYKYQFSYNGVANDPDTGAYYTSAKVYDSAVSYFGGEFTAPAGTAFVRISKDTSSTDSILTMPYQLEQSDISTEYLDEAYTKAKIQGDVDWFELVECDNIPGAYVGGTLIHNCFGGISDYVTKVYEVSNIDIIKFTGTIVASVCAYTLLDSSRAVLSYFVADSDPITYTDAKVPVVGAAFIAISSNYVYHSGVAGIRLYGYTSIQSKWKNKNMVWYGTSIPLGNGADGFSYPEQVAKKLGATVYNEAVGASPAHSKVYSRISATNPYGFRENFAASARALSNTAAETQWCINWADYNANGGVYQNGEAWDANIFITSVPVTFDAGDAAELLACSYETKLDPYLTDSTFPDLFVFDHGYNDLMDDENLYESQFGTYGRHNFYTFRGAMNFLIDKILAFRHDAKIIMIGTNDKYQTGKTAVHTNQLIVADEYELPILKLWEYSMFSQVEIPMYGYNTANGVWIKAAGTTAQTVFDSFMPDGVHPHSDKSGGAIRRITEIITPFIEGS